MDIRDQPAIVVALDKPERGGEGGRAARGDGDEVFKRCRAVDGGVTAARHDQDVAIEEQQIDEPKLDRMSCEPCSLLTGTTTKGCDRSATAASLCDTDPSDSGAPKATGSTARVRADSSTTAAT